MRAYKICGCCLLLVPLLAMLSCTAAYVSKGPEVYTNMVKISACKADPDTVRVHKGDTLTWTVDPLDGFSYTINFPNNKPISSSTVPTGQGQVVTGDFWCTSLGWIISSRCVYPYGLIQRGSGSPPPPPTLCPDPGVHIH
jgi:hypothetical protein